MRSKNIHVSLILPTYNENRTLRKTVREFEKTSLIEEIIVINNNAKFDVARTIRDTSAKEILETTQGYGAAIQKGLKKAQGKIIVICEPDGTFVANDIFKLLSYSNEFDMVLGSRTTQELIWKGANMGMFLKWGNFFVAKLVQVLFNSISLTDVGCTFRLIHRHSLKKIRTDFSVAGGHFSLEMLILALKYKLSIIQIPVNYKERPAGESTYSGTFSKAFKLGLKMVLLTFKYRLP